MVLASFKELDFSAFSPWSKGELIILTPMVGLLCESTDPTIGHLQLYKDKVINGQQLHEEGRGLWIEHAWT